MNGKDEYMHGKAEEGLRKKKRRKARNDKGIANERKITDKDIADAKICLRCKLADCGGVEHPNCGLAKGGK